MNSSAMSWVRRTCPRWDESRTLCSHLSFSLLLLLFFCILFHLLLPVCWMRPAGPAVPTLMSSPHLGQCVVVVTSYLILSVDHLVRELQLLSVNIHTFVFAIEIPGYNVGRWHTMMNIFHFFCLAQCTKVFKWSWMSVSMAHTSARCHRASKIEFWSNFSKFF